MELLGNKEGKLEDLHGEFKNFAHATRAVKTIVDQVRGKEKRLSICSNTAHPTRSGFKRPCRPTEVRRVFKAPASATQVRLAFNRCTSDPHRGYQA